MTHPGRDDLIGYLLGALDESEQARIERQLAADPQLQQELEQLRARLETLRDPLDTPEPPPDLVERTFATIEAFESEAVVHPARRDGMALEGKQPARWKLSDLVVAVGVSVAVSLLFFPAIASSRFQAQINACQNNLRQIAAALQAYTLYHNDYFPPVPAEGKLATAGCYSVILKDAELVSGGEPFVCPASPLVAQQHSWYVPTREEVERAVGRRLAELQRTMGGSYAYTLGYMANGRYYPTRNLRRSYFVIMADAPRPTLSRLESENHRGRGQNVLFEDFHIQFVVGSSVPTDGDAFFVNRIGLPAAGVDLDDAVVGRSDTPPLAQVRRHATARQTP